MSTVVLRLAVLALAPTLLFVIARAIWRRFRRDRSNPPHRGRPWWVSVLIVYLLSFSLLVPGGLGIAAPHMVHTRRDQTGYPGPRLDADGRWLPAALTIDLGDGNGGRSAPAVDRSGLVSTETIRSADGTALRVHLVRTAEAPRAVAVLGHGLFRSAYEVDPVARMFHELGCAVVMVNLRNHEGSGRPGTTFGQDEKDDVLAAVEFARAQVKGAPLVLFGVSLSSVAVARAVADVDDLAALVLDAPFEDLGATADRYLGRVLPDPFCAVALAAMQWSGGFSFDELRPVDALAVLSPSIPALVVGGSEDRIAVESGVRAVFEALPSKAISTLWIVEGSGHGSAWLDAPIAYRERVARLLADALGG